MKVIGMGLIAAVALGVAGCALQPGTPDDGASATGASASELSLGQSNPNVQGGNDNGANGGTGGAGGSWQDIASGGPQGSGSGGSSGGSSGGNGQPEPWPWHGDGPIENEQGGNGNMNSGTSGGGGSQQSTQH
jgi:hypothetical protein